MALHKLQDFLDQLLLAYNTGTEMSIGFSSNLVGVLADRLIYRNGQPPAPPAFTEPSQLLATCRLSVDTDAAMTVGIDPDLAASIIALDARLQATQPQIINLEAELVSANAAIEDLRAQLANSRKYAEQADIQANDHEVKATNLASMRDFIKSKLPTLNVARTKLDDTEIATLSAIDDICLAIDVGADPTVTKVEEDPPVPVAPEPDVKPTKGKK
jgi:hypothetical protein